MKVYKGEIFLSKHNRYWGGEEENEPQFSSYPQSYKGQEEQGWS